MWSQHGLGCLELVDCLGRELGPPGGRKSVTKWKACVVRMGSGGAEVGAYEPAGARTNTADAERQTYRPPTVPPPTYVVSAAFVGNSKVLSLGFQ